MAGREFSGKLIRRTSYPVVVLTALLLLLVAAGAAGFRHTLPPRLKQALGVQAVSAATTQTSRGTVTRATFPNQTALQAGPAVVAEYEGYFDATKNSFSVSERKASDGSAQLESAAARTEGAGDLLPSGSYAFALNSATFIPSSTASAPGGTVSVDASLQNKASYTFYNTRAIFTHFKNVALNQPAANSPSAGGLAFYNDGQVAVEGKLGVSRSFGDVAAGATAHSVFTFAAPTSGPIFYFRLLIVADLGVAADSVEPAAVQVTSQTGSSVRVKGRGFSGTPTVDLMNAGGNVVAGGLAVSNASSTSLDVAIPSGVAAGIYTVRVTNPGGTPGGVGSSRILNRLTVTGTPSLGLTELLNGTGGTGPYRLSGAVSIPSSLSIPAGTVIYVDPGTLITVTGAGNITANGGIPGVAGDGVSLPVNPAQIVITPQRAPGAALPAAGVWGGINATAAASSTMTLRNVVVEFGGASCGAEIDLTGSGRTLRFADSIVRESLGAGLKALGSGDSLVGFTRSRVEYNGTSASCDAAVQVSANAALGLYGLESVSGTSVVDGGYYYSSANTFVGNVVNAVQIGSDTDATSNDFTKSGVLTGQGDTPLIVRGSSSNPAVIGNAGAGAILTVGPNALVQIAPGTDLQAGTSALLGDLAANGFAGWTQIPGGTTTFSKRITFQKIPGSGNFGALYFSPKTSGSSILNFVTVDGGGNSSIANGQIIFDDKSPTTNNTESNNSSAAGFVGIGGVTQVPSGLVFQNNQQGPVLPTTSSLTIDTLAGSHLGDGNKAPQATVPAPVAVAVDSTRGFYLVDRDPGDSNYSVIRYVNTSASDVIIAGQTIKAGTVQTIAGGGTDSNETDNILATRANLDLVGGIALSADKKLLYLTTGFYGSIRAVNVSPGISDVDTGAITVGGKSIKVGNIGTHFSNAANGYVLSIDTRGLAVNSATGDIYVADAGNNKVFKITSAGVLSTFFGDGGSTVDVDTLVEKPNSLLKPSGLVIDAATGALYVSDSGHGRIIQIASGGASLVIQTGKVIISAANRKILDNPYPTGMALYNGSLYFANSNKHTVQRVVSTSSAATVAGQDATTCDLTLGNCGDGGAASAATFTFPTASHDMPVVGMAADASGLYVPDLPRDPYQGRVRYINLTGAAVTRAGVSVAGNSIQTVAGAGFARPYNGGLATSAELSRPVGLAVDGNNNLFIAESDNSNSAVRFVNRGSSPVVLPDGASGVTVAAGAIVRLNNGSSTASSPIPMNSASLGTLQGMTYVNNLGLFFVDANAYTVSDSSLRVKAGRLLYYNTTNATQTIYPQASSIGGSPIVVPSGYVVAIAGRVTIPDAGGGSGSTALAQRLVGPTDVAVHPTNGNIYVTAAYFTLGSGGAVSNVTNGVYKIDRNTGALTQLNLPAGKRYTGLAFDAQGRLHIAAYDDNVVLRETGSDTGSFDTLSPVISQPRDVAVDSAGNIYVTSSGSQQIIKITGGTTASGFAGKTGAAGFSGDNGKPTDAQINITTDLIKISTDLGTRNMTQIVGIAIGAGNEVIFADTSNLRIRRVH